MWLSTSVLFAAFACIVHGAPTVISPAVGQVIPGGTPMAITLQDSAAPPAVGLLGAYTITLMVGGNTADTMQPAAGVPVLSGTWATGLPTGLSMVVPADTANAGDSPNGYFLMITSAGKADGQVINYSNRFGMSSMLGTFPTAIANAITTLGTTTTGPAGSNTIPLANAGAAAGAAGGTLLPWSLQTGPIRYAPMQSIPPTKITASGTPTPLFPTSPFTVATTYLPNPVAQTTNTVAQTFSAQSRINTAAAASQPVAQAETAQQKFLERWKD